MNSSNPVTWGSVVVGVVTGVFGVLTAFDLGLSQQQEGSIITLIGALIVAGGFVTHNRVTPKSVAQDKIDQAWAAPPTAPDGLKPKA